MNLRTLLLFLSILVNTLAQSQYEEFNYQTEFCNCEGMFDSTSLTESQLRNTLNYLWHAPYISSTATVRSADEYHRLDLKELESECNAIIKKLETFDFVENEFWTGIKEDRLRYYTETCRLREVTILAYSDPDTLMSYKQVDSTCSYYRDALIAGGQQLIEAWKKVNEVRKSKNGSPERLQKKFEEKYNSPERLEHARLDVMMFGWWNNANHLIFHVNSYLNYKEEFEKLFKEFECECDTP